MADKDIHFLKEWGLRYIKNKDLLLKRIVSVQEFDDGFNIVRKEKEQRFFIFPFLNDLKSIMNKLKGHEKGSAIFCFHTKGNFDAMLNNWKEFVELGRNFMIFFVNPFSKTERVLSLCPYTHELISDDETLKQGLKTMSETVEFTTEEEIRKIINS